MTPHLDRARLLLAQSRPADAMREAGLAIAANPRDPRAHALLALARLEGGTPREALEPARTAIGLAPDVAHFHYVHGIVLHRLDQRAEARAATEEAIRLDPDDPDHFALLASLELAARNWTAALEAAEQGLAIDPEHVGSANLRATALVQLGRKAEAVHMADATLARAPENAWAHATQGWNHLHRNEPRRAQEHFREALRLEPDFEYARHGMLEALKARNPIYRGMLAYFLWMSRQSRRMQWALILAVLFGGDLLEKVSAANPALAWLFTPLLVLFYSFVYLTWTAVPVFNLLLRLDRFGRHVLSREERVASNWFAPFFLAAIGALVWWPLGGGFFALLVAIVAAMLSVCAAVVFGRPAGRRLWLGLAAAALAVLGLSALGGILLGFLGFQIAANIAAGRE